MLTMTISPKIRFPNTLCLLLLVLTNMCSYAAHAKDAESNVLRIDGVYSAELQFCNESGKGQASNQAQQFIISTRQRTADTALNMTTTPTA